MPLELSMNIQTVIVATLAAMYGEKYEIRRNVRAFQAQQRHSDEVVDEGLSELDDEGLSELDDPSPGGAGDPPPA